jgi:DNA-binding SARP family transcriptional activator
LGILLLRPNLRRRERLAGLLFPTITERRGRHRLSHTLWELRQWLPALPIESTAETLHLPPEHVWLDVDAFQQAAAQDNLAPWRSALALYRGDLLEGLYNDWLLEEREALYLEYVRLAHRVCEALWQRGELEGLLPLAEKLSQREPFDERALRRLMNAYWSVGRRGAALAAYDRFAALAAAELGVAPEPATQALAQAIQSSAVPPRTSSGIDDGNAPETLLHQARMALARAERACVEDALEHLTAYPELEEDVRLLRFDLALRFGELDHAEAILSQIATDDAAEALRTAQLALARSDVETAHERASQALMLAHEEEEPETATGALLTLAQVQQQQGRRAQAARVAERALNLARERGAHQAMAQALIQLGYNQFYQGRYTRARTLFYHARAVALEHGYRYDLAMAVRGLRSTLSHTSVLDDALAMGEEELRIWRDLGLAREEAAALEGLATIQNHLGRSADSLRTMTRAGEISKQLGDPMRTAINRYNLAYSLLYHDVALAPRALEEARAALATFQAHHQPGWEAATLIALGYTLWVNGQYGAALDHFEQAYAVSEQLGELAYLPELLAYQGLAHLGLGQRTEGLNLTGRAMLAMAQGEVSEEVIPEIIYAHAMALAANGQEAEANRTLSQAYERLLAGAASLENEEARQAFFHRNPTMRRLMGELRARGMAPPLGAGVRRTRLPAIRGGSVLVHWTVDAGPADAALERSRGSIALRRVRLARLMREAQDQGAIPSTADFAAALEVSQRTIQRDLAALRQQGTPLQP